MPDKHQMLAIDSITVDDQELQLRVFPPSHEDYLDLLNENPHFEFPAVVVFADPETGMRWLADGHARLRAYRRAGRKFIPVDLRQGDKRAALAFALSANNEHGHRRTTQDKTRAVWTALRDEEWRQWSDRRIGELCGVSHPFVGNCRIDYEAHQRNQQTAASVPTSLPNGTTATGRKFVNRYGRESTMQVDNIGARRRTTPPPVPANGAEADPILPFSSEVASGSTGVDLEQIKVRIERLTVEEQHSLLTWLSGLSSREHPQGVSVYEQVKPLIDEIDEWGSMHEFRQSPAALRVIATKLRRIFDQEEATT